MFMRIFLSRSILSTYLNVSESEINKNWSVPQWVLFMFLFYAAPDPCEGAICRIHNFCHYGNGTFDVCNCINSWNGTNCTGKIVDLIAEAA